MKTPLYYSVVIPLYNAESSIQRAINSVLAQTCQDFEMLVVNDGSTDNSLEKVREIKDERIRVFTQENQGVSSARNRGIQEAKAEFIAFLDADDEWLPEFLQTITELIHAYPQCGLFATSYFISQNKTSNPEKVNYPEGWKGILPDYFQDLLSGFPFNSSCLAIRKEYLQRISGFPANIHFGEDQNTWMRLALISKFAYINKPLSIYHREATSVTDHKRMSTGAKKHQHAPFLYDLLKSGEVPQDFHQSIIDLLAKYYYPEIRQAILEGNRKEALKLLMRVRQVKTSRWRWNRFAASCFLPRRIVNKILARTRESI